MATEAGGSNYPIGVATIVPGFVVGEPGLNFFSYNNYSTANRTNNSTGGRALPIFHANAAVSAFRVDYAPDWQLFGANVGFRAILPVVDLTIDRQVGTRRQKDSKTGVGDLTLVPWAMSWTGATSLGRLAMGAFLQTVLPVGDYNVNDIANTGRNYTSELATYAFTFITTTGWNVGFQASYIVNQINPATHYRSGNEFVFDYAVGYKIADNVTLEANGYYYRQVQNDRRFGNIVGTGNEGRAFAVGPQLRVGVGDIAVVAKWQHEMAVRNRSEGNRYWLQIFVPFGTAKPTAPANQGDVVREPVEIAQR